MIRANEIKGLQLMLASPEVILEWSNGEVTRPDTINYRTHKPEFDGLFCEKIFGPKKDYECSCGKLKKMSNAGRVCPECGVEITASSVRRERMGHIELAVPVVHPWYADQFKSRIMSDLLEMKPKDIDEISKFNKFVVLEAGESNLEYKETIHKDRVRNVQLNNPTAKISTGAEALKEMLSRVDINEVINKIETKIEKEPKKADDLSKSLQALKEFKESGNEPEWTILTVIPVIPPEIRPIIHLGTRFTSSVVNDLYRKVIIRNNKVKIAHEQNFPEIMILEAKKYLQMAVDELILTIVDNNFSVKDKNIFRQHLLGKRVDYSGRSVIVVGPELRIDQCGLPKKMALELFKPHIIGVLQEKGVVLNDRAAKSYVDSGHEEALTALEEVIEDKVVLLNRAPTLHRLGIQAFYPKLIDDKAIRLHPLVCSAFNADFDGDQMAVHLPLSIVAQDEAKSRMLASKNILLPKDGTPAITPSQDMVLGNYFLTFAKLDQVGQGKVFRNENEVLKGLENGSINLHTIIAIPVASLDKYFWEEADKDKLLITTAGKLEFNTTTPKGFRYINNGDKEHIMGYVDDNHIVEQGTNIAEHIKTLEPSPAFGKKTLENILAVVFNDFGPEATATTADNFKDLGFKYSAKSGISISAFDIRVPENKQEIIDGVEAKIELYNQKYLDGEITERERYSIILDHWFGATDQVKEIILDAFEDTNPVRMMMESGARGNISNFTQLAGIRGLMSDAQGQPFKIPVKSNFREGIKASEYFISSYGARKGSVDTALSTADSGYLTRLFVDAAQDIIIKFGDCGTDHGMKVQAIKDNNGSVVETLEERITGRYTARAIVDAKGNEIIGGGEYIQASVAKEIIAAGIEEVEIRTVMTCDATSGICQKCYGMDLSTRGIVEMGTAVGVIAGQSLGEPSTQLTMRTFHTGGVAGDDIVSGFHQIEKLFKPFSSKGSTSNSVSGDKNTYMKMSVKTARRVKAYMSEFDGKIKEIRSQEYEVTSKLFNIQKINIYFEDDNVQEIILSPSHKLIVRKGDVIEKGQALTSGLVMQDKLFESKGLEHTVDHIITQAQRLYRMHGIELADKHFEIMVRKTTSQVKIIDKGDSNYVNGVVVSINEIRRVCNELVAKNKKPPVYKIQIEALGYLGNLMASDSFVSSAASQFTQSILGHAAIAGRYDELSGLKENVIIGNVIPAGTGFNEEE